MFGTSSPAMKTSRPCSVWHCHTGAIAFRAADLLPCTCPSKHIAGPGVGNDKQVMRCSVLAVLTNCDHDYSRSSSTSAWRRIVLAGHMAEPAVPCISPRQGDSPLLRRQSSWSQHCTLPASSPALLPRQTDAVHLDASLLWWLHAPTRMS